MSRVKIAFAIGLVVLILLALLMPVTARRVAAPLRRMIPARLDPARREYDYPPYMFHVIDANTQLRLP